jgi:putative Holliday junction resolvase
MPTLKAEGWETDVAAIGRIAAERGAQALVVGLPLRMSGRAGPEARRAESFAQALREKTRLPVRTWDERLTTAASERSLIEAGRSRKKRRAAVDSAASILILQSYLDTINRP